MVKISSPVLKPGGRLLVLSPETEYYFERFGFCSRQIARDPHPDLGMVVVIPCFNEPDLILALASLKKCDRPQCKVEVIVVVNSGERTAAPSLAQNLRTLEQAGQWIGEHGSTELSFNLLHFPDLPRKKAGVGLARKIGMDEALRRFDQAGRLNGAIVCFDADCICESNYLVQIENYFRSHPDSPGCSIYFEHPLEGPLEPKIYEGIMLYELHLRYYVQALRWAEYPFAFHTIGSSMAVRAEVYRKQGGMNKRQAGEDFYFLHKVIPLGGFGDLTGTTVFASPRESDRVPFGTGRAVREYLGTGKLQTYPMEAFRDLKRFFTGVNEFQTGSWQQFASEPLATFLKGQEFDGALAEMREQTSSAKAFRKRFFWWFDGFRAMKFIHLARDSFYGPGEVIADAGQLFLKLTGRQTAGHVRELLLEYRAWEKANERLAEFYWP